MKFLAGLGLRELIQRQGMQRTRKFINKNSRGNAARTFRELSDFLPRNGGDFPIPDLSGLYRHSIQKQLAA
jgi:hypothetical protein